MTRSRKSFRRVSRTGSQEPSVRVAPAYDYTDADDAVQDTLIKYHSLRRDFESEAHLKAWLLRVAINKAKDAAKPAEKKEAAKKPAEKKEAAKKPAAKPEKKEKPAETPAAEKAEPAENPEPRTLEKPEVTMIPAEELDADSPAGIAHAFLMDLTKLMGVDVTIDMGTDAEGNVYGYINGDTLGVLIGRRGETLDAVQYLTCLKVNRGREGYVRVTLDTENYRAKREDTLIRLANRMASRARRTGRKVSLEPMNPYERRIIHYALQQTEGVSTHSEGDEPNRHVVITHDK